MNHMLSKRDAMNFAFDMACGNIVGLIVDLPN